MVYTEIKERNSRKYFYRVVSVRNGSKVLKKRKYLGKNLQKEQLAVKEALADRELNIQDRKLKSLKKLKSAIIKILKKYGIKRAGIFGSYARGEQKEGSDIDIVVEPPKGIGFGFVGIEMELEDKLGRKVDLLTYAGIHPLLKKRILNEEERII